jgi:hypothetical protein
VHDEHSLVHASLACLDEVFEVCTAGPRCVDVSIGMEYRLQILPFARVSEI